MQVSPFEKRPGSQKNSQEPTVEHQELRTSFTGNKSAQNIAAGKAHAKKDLQLPTVSLPSFIKRLVEYNVQDSAGNTSGARFVSSISF